MVLNAVELRYDRGYLGKAFLLDLDRTGPIIAGRSPERRSDAEMSRLWQGVFGFAKGCVLDEIRKPYPPCRREETAAVDAVWV